MKLKQLAVCFNIIIEKYGFKVCTSLFIISFLLITLCWLDVKTSIYSTDWEVKYVCNNVNGLGNNTFELLSDLENRNYDNFTEVKNDYRWIDLKLINQHFKFRSDYMRYEMYQFILWCLFITNAVSFSGMMGLYLYRKYRHEYILKGLTQMINDNHNNKT